MEWKTYAYAVLQRKATELNWGEQLRNLARAIVHGKSSSGPRVLLRSEIGYLVDINTIHDDDSETHTPGAALFRRLISGLSSSGTLTVSAWWELTSAGAIVAGMRMLKNVTRG